MDDPKYIPALRFRWLTPIYDPLLRWGMRENVFKQRLIRRANVHAGQRVLDLGCGTGTLTVMLKRSTPGAEIVGLDGDPQVLSIARAKAASADVKIQWNHGMAYRLPYDGESFDSVLSSLVIHHLSRADKLRTFREVRRVLKPGGALQIVDFGVPFNGLTRLQARIMRDLEEAADNFGGQIVPLMLEAGLDSPSQGDPMNTVFGPLWFYQAAKGSK